VKKQTSGLEQKLKNKLEQQLSGEIEKLSGKAGDIEQFQQLLGDREKEFKDLGKSL